MLGPLWVKDNNNIKHKYQRANILAEWGKKFSNIMLVLFIYHLKVQKLFRIVLDLII